MAQKQYNVDINLNKQQILNAAFQVLMTAPGTPAIGQFYYDTTLNKPLIWTGVKWLDMGDIYTHPDFTISNAADPALTGSKVISRVVINAQGHVTSVVTRDLTPADITAATAVHTHAFTDISGLPTQTFLGNNTAGTASAKALTVAEVLVMLSIGYGTAALLTTGTDTSTRVWSAKMINDYVTSRLATYLTVVNLALGTATATTREITNSGGSNVTLPAATTTLAGLFTAADKVKLDGIATNANNYVHPTGNPGAHPFATLINSGVRVLSQMTVTTEGHVTAIAARDLTAADLAGVMLVAGNNTTATNQTWSAAVIHAKLEAAINQAQTGALIYIGPYNPVTNTPDIKKVVPSKTVKTGYTYVVSVAGTFLGEDVEAGDMIIAKTDDPGSTLANWQLVNKNIPAILSASATVEGILRLATVAEGIAGTDNTKAITPFVLKAVLDQYTGGYYALIGNGSGTSFTVEHGLNTDRVHIQVRIVATKEEIILDWRATSATTITLNMNVAPPTNAYEVLITKI